MFLGRPLRHRVADAGSRFGDPRGRRWPWRVAATIAAAAVAAIALVGIGLEVGSRPSSDARPIPVRFSVSPPQGSRFHSDVERTHIAFSPDGSQLAFIARVAGGGRRIWLRPVSGVKPRPLTGTEGANSLFWSPDSRSLAFFAGNKLKRLDLPDGAAVPLCDVAEGIGLTGTWGADGEILFASVEGDAIMGVSTRSGTPSALSRRIDRTERCASTGLGSCRMAGDFSISAACATAAVR